MEDKSGKSTGFKLTFFEHLIFTGMTSTVYFLLLALLAWGLNIQWGFNLVGYAVILGLIASMGTNFSVKLINSGDRFNGYLIIISGAVITVLIITHYAGVASK